MSGRVAKIGVLWHAGSAEEEKVYLDILTKAFNNLGYVEGKNVVFLHRFPAEQLERFRSLARELVESSADVIVAITAPGAVVLKQTTSTIPVVFAIVPDPVGTALVASLAHPGGNLNRIICYCNRSLRQTSQSFEGSCPKSEPRGASHRSVDGPEYFKTQCLNVLERR
ncbi:hypothetical protein IVA83_08160 [Bradyrhizobium sp. 143]|nr:hypothetical protein [Bradyrhizobium sp. 143]MCK1732146.1 hypothetical protein [Bradyrhizobium sp. 142]